jgi:hypothetical protein
MFARSIHKTVQPYLHDGEALLAAVLSTRHRLPENLRVA